MRGARVFHVYGRHRGRAKDHWFGTFRTQAEARHRIEELQSRGTQAYHDLGFEIRETRVDTDFEIPTLPKPRDRYCVRLEEKREPGSWPSTAVEVLERHDGNALRSVCSYVRNHGMYGTFEPFRQRGRNFALISRDYTRTAVLDLDTGAVIAEEAAGEFCPIGFYVPDWWDVHDGSVIPGSEFWRDDLEWPTGDFGFVWGCLWGDDSHWKVQYLDLSRIGEGVVTREERFGYVELEAGDYASPCFGMEPPLRPSAPPAFLHVHREEGRIGVRFAVAMDFDFDSGVARDWRRERNTNFD